ncbi:MAG: universal stress protein [Eudoraea sp.]|nr:universal stress protein [Eudoraea sp.]
MDCKHVIVPTDFSETADRALEYARALFRSDTCTFHLLNTYTPAIAHSRFMATSLHGSLMEENVQTASEQGLQQIVDGLLTKNANPLHTFKTNSSFNILTEEICNISDINNLHLVVTGTTGASGLQEVFLGSNTVRILKSAQECPVLTIPPEASFAPPKQIAFITDYKRNFNATVLQPLLDIASAYGSKIRVMHIKEEQELNKYQESNKSILSEYLSPLSHTIHEMPYYGSKAKVIQHFLEDMEIDIVSLVHYKHGFLEELLREPVIKKVIFHTNIPLLVLPE